ncbi:MAG: Biopolymer transport protein ExbD [Myxococcota bacterium]|nr:Biopolymer transport protein ExbD [Myxococcota bacterium]
MAGQTQNDEEIISGINVTPLVDIVLVLLIIFMVTASIIMNPSIKVDLPKAANAGDTPPTTLNIVVNSQGRIFLNGAEKSDAAMRQEIAAEYAKDKNVQVAIAGDGKVEYKYIVYVIDVVKGLGIEKFALEIDKKDVEAARRP